LNFISRRGGQHLNEPIDRHYLGTLGRGDAEKMRGAEGREGSFSRGRERRDISLGTCGNPSRRNLESFSREIERSTHLLETVDEMLEFHYDRDNRFVKAVLLYTKRFVKFHFDLAEL